MPMCSISIDKENSILVCIIKTPKEFAKMLDQLLEWRKMLQSCSHRLQVCIQNSATPVDSRNLTELTSERSSAFTKVNVKPC